MDILSKLPFVKQDSVDDEVEMTEAEAKAERIKHHRLFVRNGPAKFSSATTGQVRRAKKRDLNRETRKARRRAIRQYHADQREGATIRAKLQFAGVLPFFNEDYRAGGPESLAAITWIVQHFADEAHADELGRIQVTEVVVTQSLTSALNRWQAIVGYPATRLSPAYVLPVALAS